MLNKEGYKAYLIGKKNNESLIKERLDLLDRFNAVIEQNGVTELSGIGDKEIDELKRPWNVSGRINFLHNIADFLDDYSAYVKKENPEQNPLADLIYDYYKKKSEAYAKNFARQRISEFLPAPEDFKVKPELLGEMDNAEFVAAHKELREFVMRCYEDIARAPFDWGYPDFEATHGYYNRVKDVLFAFGLCGTYADGAEIVDGAKFFKHSGIKRHKKVELMIAGFEQMGLRFDGFGKKAQSFRVSYPGNPNVMAILSVYANDIITTRPYWAWGTPFDSFSHRFVEDPAAQKFHRLFLAEIDYASDELRRIQEWLYNEAEQYGFLIDEECKVISYKKGSKTFLSVHDSNNGVTSKIIFRKALTDERMKALYAKFPETFAQNCWYCQNRQNKPCVMRIEHELSGKTTHNCAYQSYWFKNITLDDVKNILELFIIENKIKK